MRCAFVSARQFSCAHAALLCTCVHACSAQEQGQLVLISGAYVLPHPDKMAKGGEDWFYIAETMRSIGLADGVGGWVSGRARAADQLCGLHFSMSLAS